MYKHYSFDLWGTLIKSNPKYKKARVDFFHQKFNPRKLSEGNVAVIIRNVELMCDYSNELTGRNIDALEMISMILFLLEYDKTNHSARDIESIYYQLENIFITHPPEPYSPDTIPVLRYLKNQGCTLSVL